jgi:Uma2 family endonuclease
MATLPIADRFVSEEEYLSHCYEPDCDYDDGLIVGRNVGEFDHSFLQTILSSVFTANMDIWAVYALTEQRVCIAPRKYRIPDVCVLRLEAPVEDILTHPPLIAIEILSSEDCLRRVERKAFEFCAFGVPEVWVIDPRKRRAYRCTEDGLAEVEGGVMSVPGTPILVRVQELFEKLDHMRARSGK